MNPSVYYNEIDPYCAKWLANLMDAGLIPRGDIDTRSIEDVIPSELAGYDQCHFFAGLGGWAYALQLAGWGTRPVWTGSCPCQPFSAAGKGAGFADERHLWPSWQHLISQCEPPVIFGEQVAAATQWLGLVCGDLEAMGRAVGFNHIEAASAGAYHRRDRIFFVADTERACDRRQVERGEAERQEAFRSAGGFSGRSDGIAMADTIGTGLAQRERERGILRTLGCQSQGENVADDGSAVGYANIIAGQQRSAVDGWGDQRSGEEIRAGLGRANNSSHWIIGHDNKARRVEPSIRLLADGVPARVGKLRALGNAIDPRPAAALITAYMQARGLIANQQAVAA